MTESVNTSIESGLVTTVIRIDKYNEGPTDGEIEVAVYAATLSEVADELLPNPPEWLDNDLWHPLVLWVATDPGNDAGLAQESPPKYVDTKAYVNDWQLVARLDQFQIPGIYVSEVSISARIVPAGDHRYLLQDGTFAGRAKMDDLLAATSFSGICRNSLEYEQRKERTCAYADISASVPDDPSKPCDGASIAWHFEAAPALLGSSNRAVSPTPCAGDAEQPADHCPE